MPTHDDYIVAAWQVAPAFGLQPTSISVLAESENVVCEVVSSDRRVAMRFHRPGYNTLDELKSEVVWVRSLEAAGLAVPEAVPTTTGAHYLETEIAGVRVQVGVVAWVAGEPVRGSVGAADASIAGRYRIIGVLAAKIRASAAAWAVPEGFVRRRWDLDGLLGEDPLWGRFWEAELLTTEQRTVCADARDRLRDDLAAISTGPDRFGLIHADLHLGNVMADGDTLTLIDFDDSGYGWFAYEMAVSLFDVLDTEWFDHCKAAMLDGYRTVIDLDDDEAALIDTFLLVRGLVSLGWMDARRELASYEYFPHLADEVTAAARRYLRS